ncbi:MAG: SUMF1/EgtB/PvdO family nonheme iron enzyme [Terriglobales bacterium]
MGSEDFYPEEWPVHDVTVDGYWMDCHEVTNEQFREFVNATGYKTLAERPLNPADFPGAPAESGSRLDGLSENGRDRSTYAVILIGGLGSQKPAGGIRWGPLLLLTDWNNIR